MIQKVAEKQKGRPKHLGKMTEDVWPDIEKDALRKSIGMQCSANLQDELDWIRAHLYVWPDFGEAPSAGAIKLWMTISEPGSQKSIWDFARSDLSKRIGAVSKDTKRSFEEDHDADLDNRLPDGEDYEE